MIDADWAHWGPADTVTLYGSGFAMRPSRWPVVGPRRVLSGYVPWTDVQTVEYAPAERGGNLLVITLRGSRARFALWLAPYRGVELGSQMSSMVQVTSLAR